jgi:hypothetical protein
MVAVLGIVGHDWVDPYLTLYLTQFESIFATYIHLWLLE